MQVVSQAGATVFLFQRGCKACLERAHPFFLIEISILFWNLHFLGIGHWKQKIKIRTSNTYFYYLKCAKSCWFKKFQEVQDWNFFKSTGQQLSTRLLIDFFSFFWFWLISLWFLKWVTVWEAFKGFYILLFFQTLIPTRLVCSQPSHITLWGSCQCFSWTLPKLTVYCHRWW